MVAAPTCREVHHNTRSRSVVDNVGTIIQIMHVASAVETTVTKYSLQFQILHTKTESNDWKNNRCDINK